MFHNLKNTFSRLELTTEADWGEAARNLVLLIATLSFCGHIELKYSSGQQSTFLYKLENFEMPEPENKGIGKYVEFTPQKRNLLCCKPILFCVKILGSTVRNLSAFQVLQSVFLKSKSVLIGSTILDAISTIYSADDANYFLLEQQHTLIQVGVRLLVFYILLTDLTQKKLTKEKISLPSDFENP